MALFPEMNLVGYSIEHLALQDAVLDGAESEVEKVAGGDVHGGRVTVTSQRLYTLVSLPRNERRALTLRLSPGVSGFAFTFG